MKNSIFIMLILLIGHNKIYSQEYQVSHFIVAEDTISKIAYISKPSMVYFYDDYDYKADPLFADNIKNQGISNIYYTFYIETDYDENTIPVKFVSYFVHEDMKIAKKEAKKIQSAYKKKSYAVKKFFFRYD